MDGKQYPFSEVNLPLTSLEGIGSLPASRLNSNLPYLALTFVQVNGAKMFQSFYEVTLVLKRTSVYPQP